MNNRQAGRRRGRGGQRSQNNPGRGGDGNRIDNRARGNAAQLLEKYKNLARDAQMQGDRVNTEYYLQFADHYFRVLSDSRARAEENNRRQRDDSDDEDEFEQEAEGGREERGDAPRNQRRNGQANGHANGAERRDEGEAAVNGADEDAGEKPAPRRRGRPKKEAAAPQEGGAEGIDADRLPPALSAEGDEAPKPRRRRTTRAKADDTDGATSAA